MVRSHATLLCLSLKDLDSITFRQLWKNFQIAGSKIIPLAVFQSFIKRSEIPANLRHLIPYFGDVNTHIKPYYHVAHLKYISLYPLFNDNLC